MRQPNIMRAAFAALLLAFMQPAIAAPLPEPIATSLETAATHEEFRASFTLRASAPGEGALVLRYDAPTDEWTTLEGDLDALDEEMREEVEAMMEDLREPGELTYGDMKDGIETLTLLEETDAELIYETVLADEEEEMPEKVKEALDARLHFDRLSGTISRFSLRSKKPFKPVAVAKVNTLIVEQDFAPLEDGTPVIIRLYNKVEGSAFFRKFNEEYTLEFFDYEPFAAR